MISENLSDILKELPSDVKLVAVSKFHPVEAIRSAYDAGQRVFGESRPQEFAAKARALGLEGLEWHFIGHLQTNKLKLVLPYASMVESVDSPHLLQAVEDWGAGQGRTVDVLLEVHIGVEESKSGFSPAEVLQTVYGYSRYSHVNICGLMGMASNTTDEGRIREDFALIRSLFDDIREQHPEMTRFRELSIGMSGDWRIALEFGATIVRIGTAIFGPREY